MKKYSLFITLSLLFSTVSYAANWEARESQGTKYQMYRPQSVDSSGHTSLMITLHGCAQKPEDLAQHGNWETAAEKYATVVVAPLVPNGGVIFGCWDYYGSDHTEQNHHHAAVFALIQDLLQNPELKIDPHHVYVSGLSSGAGEALLLGCLRPDLISGVGLNSSPAVPSQAQDISKPLMTAADMAKFCQGLAGSHASAFASQSLSVIVADQDPLVNNQHSKIIVEAFQQIYGATTEQKFDLSTLDGPNKNGQGLLYLKTDGSPQLSFIINNGIGHAWAAGGGSTAGTAAYITQNSVDYPMYLLGFLQGSSRR